MFRTFSIQNLKIIQLNKVSIIFNKTRVEFISSYSFDRPRKTDKLTQWPNLVCKHIHILNTLSLPDKDNHQIEERKMLEKWIEMCRFEGENVPEKLSEADIQELLNATSLSQRKKYLNFLFKKGIAIDKSKIRREKLKEQKQEEMEERKRLNTGHIYYGLWRNTMFAKTYNQTIMNLYHHRLASSMIHAPSLVVDLGFDEYMRGREIGSLAEQLCIMISRNRIREEPFNLSFCNVDFNSQAMQKTAKRMPNIFTSDFPMTITSKNYLDLYPKEKLVYLTPNAKMEMTKFDPNAVYIIGGIVDLGKQEPLTMAKAKRERIKMQKLPLDRFHLFKQSKSLGIHVMLEILMVLKDTGDWKFALNSVPKRLVYTANETPAIWDEKKSVVR